MSSLPPLLDLLSLAGFLGAFVLLLRLPAGTLPRQPRRFLALCLSLYALVPLSSVLARGGVTAALEPLEPYAEVLFVPAFLFFLHSLALEREGEEGRRATAALAAASRELASGRERFAAALSAVSDGVVSADGEGKVLFLNGAAEAFTGWKAAEAAGRPLEEVCRFFREEGGEEVESPARSALREGAPCAPAGALLLVGRDGRRRPVLPSATPLLRGGAADGAILALRDLTERRALEEHAEHARKLEAAGFLAGGIAHEFNNILTGLLGSLSLARLHSGSPEADDHLESAERAGRRACGVTMRLLAFSRGGVPVKRTLHPEELVRDALDFSLRGSAVRLSLFAQEGLWPCEMDEAQAGQVVNSLAMSAMEAMPGGGRSTSPS